jgi:hypothetical protein
LDVAAGTSTTIEELTQFGHFSAYRETVTHIELRRDDDDGNLESTELLEIQ